MSYEQRLRAERWLTWVRVAAVPFAVFQAAVSGPYPAGVATWAWTTVGALAVGSAAFFLIVRRPLSSEVLSRVGIAALSFDFGVVASFTLASHFQQSSPVRQVLILVLIEAAFRIGMGGGLLVTAATVPVLNAHELLRSDYFNEHYRWENVTLQVGLELIIAVIVGWLVQQARSEAVRALERAGELEVLRDEIGRRADLLDAANRCARALGSSLDQQEAFDAFIRELRSLIPFDRTAIVLSEEGRAQVMATAGVGHDTVLRPGEKLPAGALVEELLLTGETVYRRDMSDHLYPEEAALARIGLRSRVAAPLLVGTHPIGMLTLVRAEPDAFGTDELELATLLGHLVATAVQNIRAYESERETANELRRLSMLRADFVSLVSHELRSPMAAVIGAARTLQERWRELTAEQRSSFLELIADETARLANLIGDVLHTSRIEAGTFSYSFSEVDLGELVRDTVAAAILGQDEVSVVARAAPRLPQVRGDRERLRQVLINLVDNAVKYSQVGGEVSVNAWAENGRVLVAVEDHGPGIPREHQGVIFEKFGRAHVGGGKPGTGLGLFIARSIAEAHGGRLSVRSAPGSGATFTLELPV